jgi:hypothetical protein
VTVLLALIAEEQAPDTGPDARFVIVMVELPAVVNPEAVKLPVPAVETVIVAVNPVPPAAGSDLL